MRKDSDEHYVLELVAELLGEPCQHQRTFESLRGDSTTRRRGKKLPVDGYFPNYRLIVEYHERQHIQPVPIMDRRMTVSGVLRGEQRHLYDQRKRDWAADNRLRYLPVPFDALEHNRKRRLQRDKVRDLATITSLLLRAGILVPGEGPS